MRKRLTEQQYQYINSLPGLYGDALLKYAVRFLGYKQHLLPLAEDALQETWLKAIENVDALMQHENPSAWLKLCLKRILLNKLRTASHQREELAEDVAQHPAASAQAVQLALERWRETTSLREVQEIAAMLLTPEEMQTFGDHFLYGFTADETARLENTPAATVRGRISRIRRKLRKYYLHLCIFLPVICFMKWR